MQDCKDIPTPDIDSIAATAVSAAAADPNPGSPLDGFDLLPLLDGRQTLTERLL